jgi:pimeloyl-ACP methyl ester carboxylesterase
MSTPTLVTVPCFSGAPWQHELLEPLAGYPLRSMRLAEEADDIAAYADHVERDIGHLDEFVLIGDSFGAVVALAVASRQPSGLRALVLSGGFAANPVTDPMIRVKLAAAKFLPGPLYRNVVLRLHAAALASPFDSEGEVAWTRADSRQLFVDNTPHASYVARTRAAFKADYTDRLAKITAPTLILTPQHDKLIGDEAAAVLRSGIPDATEVVLPRTGHMFRFTHPHTYAGAVARFLAARGISIDIHQDASAVLR